MSDEPEEPRPLNPHMVYLLATRGHLLSDEDKEILCSMDIQGVLEPPSGRDRDE